MLKKLNALILGCIFLFVTPIMAVAESTSDLLVGTHLARVIIPRAVVYSDENMNSPLGYISNDRLITVGNPRKKNPDLVPLIVYGRLAFIEAKSIHFENESIETLNAKRGAPREHNIDIILIKPEEKLSENNSAYFAIHEYGAGNDTKNLYSAIEGNEKSSIVGYDISLIHRQVNGKMFWGGAFEYNTITSSNIDLSFYVLKPILGYTLMRTSLFLLDLNLSFDFTVGAQLKIKSNLDTEPNAFIYGPTFGGKIVFFPNNKYHLFGVMAYRNYKVLQIENVYDSNEKLINGIGSINGLEIGVGLAFEI